MTEEKIDINKVLQSINKTVSKIDEKSTLFVSVLINKYKTNILDLNYNLGLEIPACIKVLTPEIFLYNIDKFQDHFNNDNKLFLNKCIIYILSEILNFLVLRTLSYNLIEISEPITLLEMSENNFLKELCDYLEIPLLNTLNKNCSLDINKIKQSLKETKNYQNIEVFSDMELLSLNNPIKKLKYLYFHKQTLKFYSNDSKVSDFLKMKDIDLEKDKLIFKILFPNKNNIYHPDIIKFRTENNLRKNVFLVIKKIFNFYGFKIKLSEDGNLYNIKVKKIYRKDESNDNKNFVGLFSKINYNRILKMLNFLNIINMKTLSSYIFLSLCQFINKYPKLKQIIKNSSVFEEWKQTQNFLINTTNPLQIENDTKDDIIKYPTIFNKAKILLYCNSDEIKISEPDPYSDNKNLWNNYYVSTILKENFNPYISDFISVNEKVDSRLKNVIKNDGINTIFFNVSYKSYNFIFVPKSKDKNAPNSTHILDISKCLLENGILIFSNFKDENDLKTSLDTLKDNLLFSYVEKSLDPENNTCIKLIKKDYYCKTFKGLHYENQSCFIDSTLLCLLAIPNKHINKLILEKNFDTIDYNFDKGRPCNKNKQKDIKYKKEIQKQLINIKNYMRGHKKVNYNCINLRKSLENCPSNTQNFHIPGEQNDAGEFLSYLFDIFDVSTATFKEENFFKNKGIKDQIRSNTVEDNLQRPVVTIFSSLFNKKSDKNISQFLRQTELTRFEEDNLPKINGKTYNSRLTKKTYSRSQFYIFNFPREDYIPSQNWVKVKAPESFIYENKTFYLTSIVIHTGSGHYVSVVKCENDWFFYNDIDNTIKSRVKKIGSYDKMLQIKPDPQKNGTLFFYFSFD